MKPQVLLVEDEAHIAQGIVFNLEEDGCSVTHVETGRAALELLARETFALVVLDLMLPDMDGFAVCRELRQHDQRLPVLILTARGNEADRIEGLSLGADDYLTKPFSLTEFLLRVRGMLRRSEWYRREGSAATRYRFGSNEIDFDRRLANTDRGEVPLTELELRMLQTFFAHENEVLSRRELLESVWGMSPESETRTLDNFIVRLRKYFEPEPGTPVHFVTERGRGYRFVQQPSANNRKRRSFF